MCMAGVLHTLKTSEGVCFHGLPSPVPLLYVTYIVRKYMGNANKLGEPLVMLTGILNRGCT